MFAIQLKAANGAKVRRYCTCVVLLFVSSTLSSFYFQFVCSLSTLFPRLPSCYTPPVLNKNVLRIKPRPTLKPPCKPRWCTIATRMPRMSRVDTFAHLIFCYVQGLFHFFYCVLISVLFSVFCTCIYIFASGQSRKRSEGSGRGQGRVTLFFWRVSPCICPCCHSLIAYTDFLCWCRRRNRNFASRPNKRSLSSSQAYYARLDWTGLDWTGLY